GERVRRLERGDDPLGLREATEGGERFLISRGQILDAAGVAEERVLRPDAGVVEPRGDRVRVDDLAVLIGEQRGARAVQDARPAGAEARRTGGLDAVDPDTLVLEEAVEHPDRV